MNELERLNRLIARVFKAVGVVGFTVYIFALTLVPVPVFFAGLAVLAALLGWFVFLLFRYRTLRRLRRARRCMHCGYSQEGVESATCPECGKIARMEEPKENPPPTNTDHIEDVHQSVIRHESVEEIPKSRIERLHEPEA